jgi:hypothetical protein
MDATLKRRIQYITVENAPAFWKFPHVFACNVQELILILSVASNPITFLCGFVIQRTLPRELIILLFYIGFSCLSDFLQMFLGTHHIQNLWVWYCYTPLQYAALATIFGCWQTSPFLKKLILASIPLIFALSLISILFGAGLSGFDSYSSSLSGLFILFAAGYTLFELNLRFNHAITINPAFWVCVGSIIYFGTTLLVFSMANSLVSLPNGLGNDAFIFNAVSSILANCFYSVAFLCSPKFQRLSGR